MPNLGRLPSALRASELLPLEWIFWDMGVTSKHIENIESCGTWKDVVPCDNSESDNVSDIVELTESENYNGIYFYYSAIELLFYRRIFILFRMEKKRIHVKRPMNAFMVWAQVGMIIMMMIVMIIIIMT